MGKIIAITAAMDRLRYDKAKLTYEEAVELQRLDRQRKELLATMPLKLVA